LSAIFEHRIFNITNLMKKVLREMQTLHTGCSKVEPKKIRPAADRLPVDAVLAKI